MRFTYRASNVGSSAVGALMMTYLSTLDDNSVKSAAERCLMSDSDMRGISMTCSGH